MDSIPDYAATTTTTYELPRMASELARLAEMAEMNASMEGGASTFSIIDSSKPFVKTPPKINNIPNNPYSGVVLLLLGYDYVLPNNSVERRYYRGTGFMVAPDVMVTAAHNVVNLDTPILEVRVYPYVDQSSMPNLNSDYFIYPARWRVSSDYQNCIRDGLYEAVNHDWCVMKLQASISDAYNFACSYNTNELLNKDIYISGYPHCTIASCPDGCWHQDYHQVTSSGTVYQIGDYQVWYTDNTKGGNSGSPIYWPLTRVCYAIHAYGTGPQMVGLSKTYNSGTKITTSIYNVIAGYVES